MNTIKCIIADDEPIARQLLENYIEDIPNLELITSCKNAFEVMAEYQKQAVDLLILDINMPKLSGLSLIKSLKDRPSVIITTAYPEYALEGFELSVTDYLLKPFSFERFLQAVLKVKSDATASTQATITQIDDKTKSIFVKSDKKVIKIDLETIVHIEAYGNYIKVYADEMILVPETLSHFLETLTSDFIRIHKSHAINFNHLKLIDGNRIILDNNVKLPIGKSYRKALLDRV